MRNYRLFLCSLYILIFSYGCRLDGDTLVEGKVVDAFSGQPVPNAWVSVFGHSRTSGNSSIIGWGSGGVMYKFLGEGHADNKGRFNFQVDGNEADGPFELRAGLLQGNYLGYTVDNEIKKSRNNKDLVIKFKQPWPTVIHMQDTGARTKTRIDIGDFQPYPKVYFYNVQDTIFRTTLLPYENPYPFYYYFSNYSAGISEERKRIDINLPQHTGDTIRLDILF